MAVLYGPRVGPFIIATLAADTGVGGVAHASMTGGRIYRGMIPSSVNTYPAIVVSSQAITAASANGANHVLDNALWTVKIVNRGESQVLSVQIADRVHTLLQGRSGTQDGVYIPPLNLSDTLPYPEFEGNQRFEHLDLTYRVFPHAA